MRGFCLIDLMQLKCARKSEAVRFALPIRDKQDEVIGILIPVGSWILGDPDTIAAIAEWRARAMRMFLIQFESTIEGTTHYLKNLSIGQTSRILFMLQDTEGSLVGHVGLADVTETQAELDNLMRGKRGGPPDLMRAAECEILKWGFGVLGLESIHGRILSYNFLAMDIHKSLGFVVTEEVPLFREKHAGQTTLEPCSAERTNVSFTCNVISLDRDDFRAV